MELGDLFRAVLKQAGIPMYRLTVEPFPRTAKRRSKRVDLFVHVIDFDNAMKLPPPTTVRAMVKRLYKLCPVIEAWTTGKNGKGRFVVKLRDPDDPKRAMGEDERVADLLQRIADRKQEVQDKINQAFDDAFNLADATLEDRQVVSMVKALLKTRYG